MVVTGVTRPVGHSAPLRRQGTERAAFGLAAQEAPPHEGTGPIVGPSVTSLLALQEAESDFQQDREAAQHGTAVVDELSELQRALLGGDGPDLERLAVLMARPVRAADPGLAGLLRAVRLRAGVELARRGWPARV